MHRSWRIASFAACLLVLGVHLTSCDKSDHTNPTETPASSVLQVNGTTSSASSSTPPSPTNSASNTAPSPPPAASSSAPAFRTEGCPAGMVRVEGEYCPAVIQHCLKHHSEYVRNRGNKNVSERCLEYEKPSKCHVKKRIHMSFCMDRFEYPNQVGELPQVLTSWRQAKNLCGKQGKRLCSVKEFNFACEGPEMLPQVNGYNRDPQACNIDKPYHMPDHSKQMLTYKKCLKDERCSKELQRLDQRHRIGEKMTCASWAGLIDLNGNVNEWVEIPDKKPPNRSGLKGGWWGPVRNRCRPTVTFHKEEDYGYEAGFRCCKDSK
jgi:formylglycine-generating enzyme